MYWSKEWQEALEAFVISSVGPMVKVIFIINGEDVLVETFAQCPLADARDRALAESHNTGRPPEEWEIRDERGWQLDPNKPPPEIAHFPRYFLTLKVGVGGDRVKEGNVGASIPLPYTPKSDSKEELTQ